MVVRRATIFLEVVLTNMTQPKRYMPFRIQRWASVKGSTTDEGYGSWRTGLQLRLHWVVGRMTKTWLGTREWLQIRQWRALKHEWVVSFAL